MSTVEGFGTFVPLGIGWINAVNTLLGVEAAIVFVGAITIVVRHHNGLLGPFRLVPEKNSKDHFFIVPGTICLTVFTILLESPIIFLYAVQLKQTSHEGTAYSGAVAMSFFIWMLPFLTAWILVRL